MSIEVESEKIEAAPAKPDVEPARPAQAADRGRGPFWRRRAYQLAAVGLLAVLVAGVVGVNLLARQYTPDGAVRQYLSALQSRNANAAWDEMSVTAPTQAVAFSLTDQAALRAALAYAAPDIKSFDVAAATKIDANTSSVDVAYQTSSGSEQAKFIVQRSGENRYGLFPIWRVVITPTLLQVKLPKGLTGASIDGKQLALPAGASSIVAVLPVWHRLQFKGSDLVAPESETVDAFFSLAQTVAYQPTLTTAGSAQAKSAIAAAVAACAKQTSAGPDGCPQKSSHGYGYSGAWLVVGDPTSDLAVSFDSSLTLVAKGHYQMSFAYQESASQGTIHDISAGGYAAALEIANGAMVVDSIAASADVPALQRPAGATDELAKSVVAQAMSRCTGATIGLPADCPQWFVYTFADNIHWKLNGDSTASASVSFDAASGIFTVKGSFNMGLTYTVNGYSESASSSTNVYEAYLLWDGQTLQVITISGDFS